jgi:DNA mismatch repair protein MSH4
MPSTCCERTGTASQLFTQLRTEVSNVEIVPTLRRAFSEGRGLQRVKQLVVDKFSTVVQVVTQKYYCLAAAAALLHYVELSQSIIFSPKSMKVEFQGSDNTCMIDSKTAQNLELLHNAHKPVSSHSVLGMLGNCRTPGGARLLRMHILQPPCDLKLIQQRLDCVDELIESREILCGLEVRF